MRDKHHQLYKSRNSTIVNILTIVEFLDLSNLLIPFLMSCIAFLAPTVKPDAPIKKMTPPPPSRVSRQMSCKLNPYKQRMLRNLSLHIIVLNIFYFQQITSNIVQYMQFIGKLGFERKRPT